METLLQDLRYGARTLRKSPGFTVVALIALALGIGANSAMFSIVNSVLLRSLPYPEPDRLALLFTSMPQFKDASVSYPNFLDWQQRSRSFEQMAAYRNESFTLTGQENPERLRGLMASSSFFSALRTRAIVGRVFTADEDSRGAAPVAVLTDTFWKNRFGGDRQIVGRNITLNEKLYTVIGVVPGDDVLLRRTSVLVPIGQWTEPLFWDRSVGMGMRVVGRLKEDVQLPQAKSELDSIGAGLAREYPKDNKNHGIYSVALHEYLVGDVRTPLLYLLGAVGLVLLIACANVANLLLARSTARRREFAVRGALGATRLRIIRQLLTESILLAVSGGALGLGIAYALDRIFVARLANQLPRADQIHLDSSVLLFTALVSLVASVLFGITPALQSARSDLNSELKEGGRGNTRRGAFQRSLVVIEVALALVVTSSAGLMIRTMSQLWSVNPGFDPENVLTLGVAGSPAVHGAPTAVRNGIAYTMDQIRAVPGVKTVSVNFGGTPMNGDSELPYWIEGRPKPEQSQMDLALFYGVDGDYFDVMRIPLLKGRLISARDNENTACSIDVDEDFARKNFPNQDPIGQHANLELISMKCTIVGVVGHIKHWGLDSDTTSKVHSQMYIPYRQFPDSVMDLASTGADYLIRTAGDPYSVVPSVKHTISAINGKMVGFGEESMHDIIKDSLSSRRFMRLLLGTFAALAVVLAGVGIYGVLSYAVSQSTHEIGVRMALGANTGTVLGMVLKDAMRMAGIGIGIGAVAALLAARLMKGLLFGVSTADPITFLGVALLLAMVALLASYVPAGRATKVDPIIALRYE
jgi:predicted permease